MNYNAVEMKRIGVDPTGWKWFNNDYSRYQVMDPSPVTYELKKVTRAKPGRFAIFIAAFCAVIVSIGVLNPGTQYVPINVTSFVACIGIVAFCVNRSRWMKAIGFLLLTPVIIIAFAMLYTGHLSTFFIMALFVASPFVLWHLWRRSLHFDSKLTERKRRLTGLELWSNPVHRVYGSPGGVASAVSKFGKEAVDAGVEGENRTASLLWLLLKIPGVTVFHGLRFPNSKRADVDHAVLHGSNVY